MGVEALDPVAHLRGKSVLVTGAGGSIGTQICQQVLAANVKQLTLVSLTESGLYNVERKLRALNTGLSIVSVLGNVGDRNLMQEVMAGVDIVIHAAAHKHVPICEQNPLTAIENNVGGTYTLALAAVIAGVKQFVLISTDKAVRPTSIMGATKRLAELIMRDCLQSYGTDFFTVRFGNVLDSDGSVLPLWREQIAKGGPITMTDPRCERYFMSIPEAVDLVLQTLALKPAHGTFVLEMGARRKLLDMARELIGDRDIAINITGLRPGEKLIEELHHGAELYATEHPKIFRLVESAPAILDDAQVNELLKLVYERRRNPAVDLLRKIAA